MQMRAMTLLAVALAGSGPAWAVTPEQVGIYRGKVTFTKFNFLTGVKTAQAGIMFIKIHEGTGFDFLYQGADGLENGFLMADGQTSVGQAIINETEGLFMAASQEAIFSSSLHFQKGGVMKGAFTSSNETSNTKNSTVGTFTVKKEQQP